MALTRLDLENEIAGHKANLIQWQRQISFSTLALVAFEAELAKMPKEVLKTLPSK